MVRHVFICSAGHSGSTLLDLLLGSHSRAESLGEITQLPKNIALNTVCTCGSPVRECHFWVNVINKLSRQLGVSLMEHPYAFDLGFIDSRVVIDKSHQTRWYRLYNKLMFGFYYLHLCYGIPLLPFVRRKIQQITQNNILLYGAVLSSSGKSCIVDSSKSYLKALAVYKAAPDATRIIVLKRDGRGVFRSGLKRGLSPKHALKDWLTHYQHAIPLYGKHLSPDAMLSVKYEDLASNTAVELKRICDFLGLSYEPRMLEYADSKRHVTNGNVMRFVSKTIRLDEAWRSELSPAMQSYFAQRAGRLNALLGYY